MVSTISEKIEQFIDPDKAAGFASAIATLPLTPFKTLQLSYTLSLVYNL